MLFAPLSERRFAYPLAFVVDPYAGAIVGVGFAAAWLRPHSRVPALGALALLLAYLGTLVALHERVLRIGAERAAALGLAGTPVHALPQPLAPFHWKIIVDYGEDYDEAHVSLWRVRAPRPPAPGAGVLRTIAAGYFPPAAATWRRQRRFGADPARAGLARSAWNAPALADFRRFARFPVLLGVESAGEQVCVRFADLRFALPGIAPSFRYEACRTPGGPWRLERVAGSFWID